MALPSTDALPISGMHGWLAAAWHGLEANGLPVLIAIYFVAVACIVLLSLYVGRLSAHIRQLRREVERDAALVGLLMKSTAEQTRTAAAPAAAVPAPSGPPTEKPELDLAVMRSELESVLDELWSENSETAAPDRQPEP